MGKKELTKEMYEILRSKEKTKNLRDRLIIEFFDNKNKEHSTTDSYKLTALHFGCSFENIKYIVRNRFLIY